MKTWQEKLHTEKEKKLTVLPYKYGGMNAGDTMLVATPKIVNEEIKSLKKGRAITIAQFRSILAEKYHADGTCPLSTSIFIRIAAEAWLELAEEDKKKSSVPFWRVISPNDKIAKKISCGLDFIAKQRHAEGIE